MVAFSTEPVDEYTDKLRRVLKPTGGIQIRKVTNPTDGERRVLLESNTYPDPVTAIELTITYAETGGLSVTYRENWDGDYWECRWGRHPNAHNTDDHFHYPPDAGTSDMPPAVDASYKQDILVMTDIGDFLAERYLDIVSSESATYPSQYTWTNEYCSATYEFPP